MCLSVADECEGFLENLSNLIRCHPLLRGSLSLSLLPYAGLVPKRKHSIAGQSLNHQLQITNSCYHVQYHSIIKVTHLQTACSKNMRNAGDDFDGHCASYLPSAPTSE